MRKNFCSTEIVLEFCKGVIAQPYWSGYIKPRAGQVSEGRIDTTHSHRKRKWTYREEID
jgi:hypothetical protein